MLTPTLNGPAAAPTDAGTKTDPAELQKATREFEAMWIETMLHSVRPEAASSLGGESGGDSTRDMVLDMADQQLAKMLAAQGGLGLAKLVRQGLGSTRPATGNAQADAGANTTAAH